MLHNITKRSYESFEKKTYKIIHQYLNIFINRFVRVQFPTIKIP